MVDQLRYRLSIELPENTLVLYQTMDSLAKAIATCSVPLKLQIEPGEESDPDAARQTKPPRFTIHTVLNYVWNIPSDYFRLHNPKKVYHSAEEGSNMRRTKPRKSA